MANFTFMQPQFTQASYYSMFDAIYTGLHSPVIMFCVCALTTDNKRGSEIILLISSHTGLLHIIMLDVGVCSVALMFERRGNKIVVLSHREST